MNCGGFEFIISQRLFFLFKRLSYYLTKDSKGCLCRFLEFFICVASYSCILWQILANLAPLNLTVLSPMLVETNVLCPYPELVSSKYLHAVSQVDLRCHLIIFLFLQVQCSVQPAVQLKKFFLIIFFYFRVA